jgi:hypothetical protein
VIEHGAFLYKAANIEGALFKGLNAPERSLGAMELRNTPTSYVQFLKPDGLRGARIGLLLGVGSPDPVAMPQAF